MLLSISSLTDCSIHWLLTGEGPKSRTALLQSNGTATAEAEEEIRDDELAALYHNYDAWTDEDKEEMRRVVRFVRKKLQEEAPQKKKRR